MNTPTSAAFGLLFLGLSFALTFLMYYLWSFPYDKETHTSSAPKSLMRLHRMLGYGYVAIYVLMMSQMVPRMWQYQVEFPARTVAHMILGFLIGILLFVKLAILRFFRYFERWMPVLGTALFVCTALLAALSVPTVARERALASAAVGGGVFSPANRERVAGLLPLAGLPAGADTQSLSTVSSLRAGRTVLLDACVRCHDLRTVLAKPRTPSDWLETVRRMADKPALFAPITEPDQQRVSAYLIAITPDLQQSAKRLRQQANLPASAQASARAPVGAAGAIDPVAARAAFRRTCSQCHALTEVDSSPPHTADAVRALMRRMTANGMRATPVDARLIEYHLVSTYAQESAPLQRKTPAR